VLLWRSDGLLSRFLNRIPPEGLEVLNLGMSGGFGEGGVEWAGLDADPDRAKCGPVGSLLRRT